MIKKIHVLSFLCAFLAVSLLSSALFSRLFQQGAVILTGNEPKEQRVIVIDAGHGGIDGGTSGSDGTPEKELNLAIAKKLAALFTVSGYTVIQTREDDRSLAAPDAPKGHVKQSDLDARLEVLTKHPNSLFLSIHMNAYQGTLCRGLQVWYSQNNEASAEYALTVQSGVKAYLQQDNHRKIKAATSSIYLLKKAINPAILIECGFLSNEEECEKLKNEEYQKALALAIFASLHQKMRCNT